VERRAREMNDGEIALVTSALSCRMRTRGLPGQPGQRLRREALIARREEEKKSEPGQSPPTITPSPGARNAGGGPEVLGVVGARREAVDRRRRGYGTKSIRFEPRDQGPAQDA